MYAIAYTKTVLEDIPKLKAAHLGNKAKALIVLVRENPYKIPPHYEKLVGNLSGLYSAELINSTGLSMRRYTSRNKQLRLFRYGRIMSGIKGGMVCIASG